MKFTAFERSKQGTGASRRLRITGRTPGIVYGGTTPPQSIEIDHNALWHALKKEAFHSSVLTMEIGDTSSPVLLRDVQAHPFKQLILHVDFQRVDASTKLHMKVPLHFHGDENSPAIKTEGCIANHVISEIDVLCLPADLPEFIKVDLSGLKKGSSLHLAEITLPKGVTAVKHGSDKNPVIVSVVAVAGAEPAAAAEPAADAAAKPAAKAAAKSAAKPAEKANKK
ncbi:50S ribosomal protein L25/general stress protein Ctc [Rhodoferax sp.]|jgi:large subunit ribosomal protein L25|uniref:50S ribosomal protein L25/general stress protein Ctc n=1 Tax=Rhodoferax sp. TaxID=50421 RepID=UPI0027264EB8|nr:50S ribosomal protein L25/general stress protein Ctc [Rhodoferax sp.]MDO9143266.1 50S ribosomal protein L25/general stress protein Ctc [Rhodoferax sp.]MDP3192416.1 50S ribosomal protein L25/general stress protein Ctc [Rhodoferax sp.]MDP3338373.1 50S ribosomal protein L25/general stress protein Ctc [Rhodoferax sp.]MDP3864851.1 50S ribosomal protein L25/general stress protein Ctc [Rhodoferax sp.]